MSMLVEPSQHADTATVVPPGQLVTWDAVKEFVFAGNARFTLRSLRTGMRYTYLVRARKEDLAAGKTGPAITYFASLLRGPDNEADYKYMGVVRLPGHFWITPASKMGRDAPAYKVLVWFLDRLRESRDGVLGAVLEVWHEGKCGRCGRTLTVPESIANGLGPVCDGRAA